MTVKKKPTLVDADLTHQLARRVVDRTDVVCVEGVAQAGV
jgi:hypothetical protein